jgi:hypothetical protein
MPSSQPKEGGIKGFLSRAGNSFYAIGTYCKEKSWVAARMAGNLAFIVATTSMVVLMPLIFEIMREGQVCFECTPCDAANSSILLTCQHWSSLLTAQLDNSSLKLINYM